ncbi:hypothetical protein GCK72_007572 [Caenorhabditis remanei]|uniref:BTB domain-containing protein n=1 Tax=Caenorhabditis remanei TaxID=31234 RepID=A0A6A5HMN1_CAERE|nr:hypothetical protein GCK72_007572 [Caenorhabditis remanei]KAF1767613.1 hypothetical protein GCK72_007572 [Caenorhabditis remanei]
MAEAPALKKQRLSQARKNLREFDGSDPNHYDMILVVEDEKFHVCKMYLAIHSTYFNTLFYAPFAEKEKEWVELKEVGAEEFQHFLECIHGDLCVDDQSVGGILRLSNMWEAKTATQRCEHYLVHESRMSKKEKFELADLYNLQILQNSLLADVTTGPELQQILPIDLLTLNHDSRGTVLRKAMDLLTAAPPVFFDEQLVAVEDNAAQVDRPAFLQDFEVAPAPPPLLAMQNPGRAPPPMMQNFNLLNNDNLLQVLNMLQRNNNVV